MGLPISQRFVQLMGGELTASSVVGNGSVFAFQIQTYAISSNDVPMPESSRQVIGLEEGQPAFRILVAEDILENRRLLVELLTPVGFEVKEAVDGQAAIEVWKVWSPHLIWMDIRMPVLNGFEATRQIKAAGDPAPVIIALTGSAFEEDRITALLIGCDDFVRKPFRTSTIFEKMAEHLGVRYLFADAVNHSKMEEITPLDISSSLTVEAVLVMPVDWIKQLHQAALEANTKHILVLIEQIPESENDLIWTLIQLVDRPNFKEIVAATKLAMLQQSLSAGTGESHNLKIETNQLDRTGTDL